MLRLLLLTVTFMMVNNSPIFARVGSLQGVVSDLDTQATLPGINVIVIDHNYGAATNPEGRFFIESIPEGKYSLLFSAIGYENKYVDVQIPSSEVIRVSLKETFFQMNSVVVTGTRSDKIHMNTPIATEVITTHDIQNSGARDLGELLEQRAGVSVSSSVEGGTIVNVLGMDSKYVMILIDGQPITGKFNNRNVLDQVTISNIEKVEIVKGPGSSLYGSEAMGGVINIITNTDKDKPPLLISYRYSDRVDQFDPSDTKIGQRNIRLSSGLSGGKYRFNMDADVHLANVDKSIQHIDVDQFQTYSVRNRLRYNIHPDHQLSLDATFYQNHESGSATLLSSKTSTNRASGNLKYDWTLREGVDLNMVFRHANYLRDYEQTRPWGEIIREELTEESQSEFELISHYVKDNLTLNIGSEIGLSTYTSERVFGGIQKSNDQAIFTQLDITFREIWTLVGGVRWDNSSDFSSVTNPRLALLYQPDQRWRYRFSAGSGYRKPSFLDRYINWNHQQFGYRVEGNALLEPEQSFGLTAGVDYYHTSKYQASLFVYLNQFSNMIVDSLLEPGVFTYVNVEKVHYSGAELKVRWSINTRWLSSWGYTYSLNRNALTGEIVPNLPNHSGTLKITYKHPKGRWSGSAKVKAVGSYDVDEFIVLSQQLLLSKRDGYMMVDLDGYYHVKPWLKFSSGVRNVLDETDERYGPFFGRTLYLELQTTLKGR